MGGGYDRELSLKIDRATVLLESGLYDGDEEACGVVMAWLRSMQALIPASARRLARE